MSKPIIAATLAWVTMACQTTDSTAKSVDTNAAEGFQTVASCSAIEYFGGWAFELIESTQSGAVQMTIWRASGPDGDGQSTPAQTVAGVRTNADQQNPQSWDYKFADYEVSLGLIPTDGLYTAKLKFLSSGETDTLECTKP